jgi:hypothetical protein
MIRDRTSAKPYVLPSVSVIAKGGSHSADAIEWHCIERRCAKATDETASAHHSLSFRRPTGATVLTKYKDIVFGTIKSLELSPDQMHVVVMVATTN